MVDRGSKIIGSLRLGEEKMKKVMCEQEVCGRFT